MDLNFLQQLGIVPPGPGVTDPNAGYGDPSVPAYASDPMSMPQPQNSPPDVNALQALNGGTPNASPPPVAISAPANPPRERRSLLDTIGRAADVLAKVGGAEALYQPTLDARQDRALSLGDHAQQVDLNKLKIASAQGTLDDAGRARLSQAVRGTQALLAANPQADISKIFPLLAARAGIDPTQAATIAGELAQNPGLLDGLAGFDDSGDKYGGSVVYAKGPDGKIVAFQPNLKGGKGRAVLPDGFEAVDPLKIVDTGGSQVAIGGRSGDVVKTFDKTAKPDTVLNTQTQRDIAAGKNATAITVAGMPARAKSGTAGDGKKGDPAGALAILDNIQASFDKLHKLEALPGEGGAVGNIIGTLGRTTLGQSIGARTGLSAAAQERELLTKNLGSLQSEMIKSLPGAATRTKFEQEIQRKRLPDPATMNYATARSAIDQIRAEYRRAQQPGYAVDSGPATGTRKLPPRLPGTRAPVRARAGKPSISNW